MTSRKSDENEQRAREPPSLSDLDWGKQSDHSMARALEWLHGHPRLRAPIQYTVVRIHYSTRAWNARST